MAITEEQIRLIFGLKLRQLREEKDLSLFGLSKKTGLSKSYLNEIEKGKKYPKPDKIVAIAGALDTPYDEMVSMKLSGKMAPLSDIVMSGVLKEIPLELFGIEEGRLLDIISHAPEKVSAFIGTLFEIARNRNVTREHFYLSAVRAHQEMFQNYFQDLEEAVLAFAKRYSITTESKLSSAELEELLVEEFSYSIQHGPIPGLEPYAQVRSLYHPGKRLLYIADGVSESQRQFILAKELAYCHLKLEQRPLTFTWIKFGNFEDVLNNFKASYFAGALLLNEQRMVSGLKTLFAKESWNADNFFDLMAEFTDSAETFFQRLTNLLPKHFGMRDMFFLRFSYHPESERLLLTKEFHLGRKSQPHAVERREHYCRRWASADVMLRPERYPSREGLHLAVQRSRYSDSGATNLIVAASTPDPFNAGAVRSVCLGMELNARQKKALAFHADEGIPTVEVGLTCERCPLSNCAERAAAPTWLKRQQEEADVEAKVQALLDGAGLS